MTDRSFGCGFGRKRVSAAVSVLVKKYPKLSTAQSKPKFVMCLIEFGFLDPQECVCISANCVFNSSLL